MYNQKQDGSMDEIHFDFDIIRVPIWINVQRNEAQKLEKNKN